MTKRSRVSIAASSSSEPSERQLWQDAAGVAEQEGAEGSALKKARSFMATLVSADKLVYCHSADDARPVIYAGLGRQDAMRIDLGVGTARP